MDNRTRGKPPVGTYVGKVIEPVRIGQRESKTGSMYDSGDIAVHVKGGSGPVQVDGEYEFNGLSFDILDFFKARQPGDVFVFSVFTDKGYKKFAGLTTKEDLETTMGRFAE